MSLLWLEFMVEILFFVYSNLLSIQTLEVDGNVSLVNGNIRLVVPYSAARSGRPSLLSSIQYIVRTSVIAE